MEPYVNMVQEACEFYTRTGGAMLSGAMAWMNDAIPYFDMIAMAGGAGVAAAGLLLSRRRRRWLLAPALVAACALSPAIVRNRLPLEEKLPTQVNEEWSISPYEAYLSRMEPALPPREETRLIAAGLEDALLLLGEGRARVPLKTSASPILIGFHNRVMGSGLMNPLTGAYVLRPGLSPVYRATTLAHEMAHAAQYYREEEAEAISILALLQAPDPFLNACGCYARLRLEGSVEMPSWFRELLRQDSRPPPEGLIATADKRVKERVQGQPTDAYVEGPRRILRRTEESLGVERILAKKP